MPVLTRLDSFWARQALEAHFIDKVRIFSSLSKSKFFTSETIFYLLGIGSLINNCYKVPINVTAMIIYWSLFLQGCPCQGSFNYLLLLRCNECLLVLKLVRVSFWRNYVCLYKFMAFFYSWRFCCSSGDLSAGIDPMTGYGEICYRALYLQYQRQKVEEVSDERVRFEMSTMGGIHVCTNCRLFIIMLSMSKGLLQEQECLFLFIEVNVWDPDKAKKLLPE